MAEITQAEQIRLGDFKEQFASTKKNIDSANDELESILVKRDLHLAAFELKRKEQTMALESLALKRSELEQEVIDTQNSIQSSVEQHERSVKEFEVFRNQKEMEIFSRLEEADELKEENESIVLQLKSEIEQTKPELKKLELLLQVNGELLADTNKEISENNRTLGLLKKDLARINMEREDAVKRGSDELARLQIELDKARMNVAKEVDKTSVPKESLASEKAAFETYKMDVRVLYTRANQMWSLMYPGKSLEDILKPQ